jgi:hypothetical protein
MEKAVEAFREDERSLEWMLNSRCRAANNCYLFWKEGRKERKKEETKGKDEGRRAYL